MKRIYGITDKYYYEGRRDMLCKKRMYIAAESKADAANGILRYLKMAGHGNIIMDEPHELSVIGLV